MRWHQLACHVAKLKLSLRGANWSGIPKGAPVCARCDRVGYVQVLGENGPEWRCDWHLTETLPAAVKHGLFDYVRRFI
jgi:hypothetical protein